jgi:hypothetical protein
VCVCTICLSFRCLGLCILTFTNVYKLYRVSLSTQSFTKWGSVKLDGQLFLHIFILLVFTVIFFLQNCILKNSLYQLLGLELPILHLLFIPSNFTHRYDCSISSRFGLSYMAIVYASSFFSIFLLFSVLCCSLFVLFLSVILS